MEEGQKLGRVVYLLNGKELGQTDILAAEGVEIAGWTDWIQRVFDRWLYGVDSAED